ncbi:MAG: hypothetical protein AAFY22_13155, partial [Pseudomonadota bacterium]
VALLAEFEFPSGTQRVFSGSGGPLIWDNGGTPVKFAAAGDLVFISATLADLEGRQTGHSFTISVQALTEAGLSDAERNRIVDGVLAEDWQGDLVRIYYAVFAASNTIVGNPILVAQDRLDSLADTGGNDTWTVTVRSVPDGADRDTPVQRVFSPEDQRTEFPTDTGMDRQPSVGVKPIRIGAAPASGGGQSGSVSGESISGAYRGR